MAALLVLMLVSAPAEASESREFKSNNVKWTLPDGWNFKETSDSEKQAGFFAAVESGSVSGRILAYRKPDNGLSPQDFANEVAGVAMKEIPDGAKISDHRGTISGRNAHVIAVNGKNGNAVMHVRLYLTHFEGHYYILWIRAFHEHHKKKAEEIDAVRRGFRLLKGGGPDEKPDVYADPTKDPAEGAKIEGEGGISEAEWKDTWPKREGTKLSWTKHNVSWDVAEDSGYALQGVLDDEGFGEKVLYLREDERSQRPQNKEEAVEKNEARCLLVINERGPGYFPHLQVENDEWKGRAARSLGQMLPGSQRIETEDIEVDGIPAARFLCQGKNEHGDYTGGIWTFVALRDRVFVFVTRTVGDRAYFDQVKEQALKLLGGVSFGDKSEPIFGPVLGANPTHNMERGGSKDRERELRAPGVVLLKPKGVTMLVQLQNIPGVRWAIEQRSDDGKHFFYMHLAAFTAEELRQAGKNADRMIQDRADLWKSSAGDGATFKESRGQIKTKGGKFGKAKGDKYEMKTDHHGASYVEEGYFVKWKQNFYHIVIQYGGDGAQKKFKKLVKDLQKRMEWLK